MAAPAYQRFDHTQKGAGLMSQGLEYNSAKIFDWYNSWKGAASSPYQQGIVKGMQAYAKNNPANYNDPGWVTNAIDWYFRDNQRKSQKAPTMFGPLDSIIKPVLTIGAGLINPALGAAVGAGLGAANGGGLMGGLLGGISGYGAGGTLKSVAGAFSGAGGLSTLLSSPGTFASNLGRSALTSLQNYLPGYGGSVSSALGGVASSAGGLLSSAARGGSGAAASPGGGMSFFSDLLKGLAPDLIGGGIQYLGAKSAQEDFSKIAQQLQSQAQFNPYNVSGPAGSASFFGNNATASLSPELQAQLGQMDTATRGAFEDYQKFNAGGYANNYYKTITDMRRPTDQAQTNDLLNRVYATGNWGSTVGAQDVYSYQQAKSLEDAAIKMQAQEAGAVEQDRLFNRYFKSASSTQDLATLPYDLINQGGNLGGTASNSAVSASQYPWLAEQSSVAASANFWSTIGSGVSNVLGKYAGYQKNANRPVYTPSPYFSGGNSTFGYRA